MGSGLSDLVSSVCSKEYCPSHKHVEWRVSYKALQDSGHLPTNHIFTVERQMYLLDLTCDAYGNVKLRVFRKGRASRERSFSDRCWAGLKRSDGSFHHKIKSCKPSLEDEHRKWREVDLFSYFSVTDLVRLYLTSGGDLIFFFRMNVERVPAGIDKCIHGRSLWPSPVSGTTREGQCFSHKQVEWDVDYEAHPKDKFNSMLSPVFKIGTQLYYLESRCGSVGNILLRLYRLGRSVVCPYSVVRFWAGLKCEDGSYNHKNFSGLLDLREDLGLWTMVACFQLPCYSDFEDKYLMSDNRLTFFFRMNLEPTEAETFTHGTPPEPSPVSGRIREKECSSHMHVEWDVGYATPLEKEFCLSSPVFQIGDQFYFFESCYKPCGDVSLLLYRCGRSAVGPNDVVRSWMGLKCKDGTYYHRNFSQKLDLRESFGLWTEMAPQQFFCRSDLEQKFLMYQTLDQRLIFFLRMNVESTGVKICTHGTPQMPAPVTGKIREEECSSHKHVEWDIDYAVPGKKEIHFASPVFKIGTQIYFLDLLLKHAFSSLSLYRLGHSVDGHDSSVRCWAGLKYRDGNYPLTNFSETLDLREELGMWTRVAILMDAFPDDVQKDYVTLDRSLITFFFRMNVKPTGAELCTHGPVNVYAPEGRIREEECPNHKHVQWDITYLSPIETELFSTSPVFVVGNQSYLLNLFYASNGLLRLELYRYGRAVEGPASSVLCWAGLKQKDGHYHHQTQNVELNLREENSFWTKVASFRCPYRSDLQETHLTSDQLLTFFCQINLAQSTTDHGTCAHGAAEMCAPGEGCIRERGRNFFEWIIGEQYERSLTSPVFKVGNQCFLLELHYETDGIHTLSLYRFGRPVEGYGRWVRCWAGLKDEQGTYLLRVEGAELDMRKDCGLWTKVLVMEYFSRFGLSSMRFRLDGNLTFFCQMDNEESQGFIGAHVQTDEDRYGVKKRQKDKNPEYTEEFEKRRQYFRLWLQNPEEGDHIRRLLREDFEAKQWKQLKEELGEEKEPVIFAA